MLQGSSAVSIEEPEAHLHAPTTGLQLRQLLRRLLDEGHIEQLFVATHRNLFDLDPSGYWDVSLDASGSTVVKQISDLSRIDERHLYEPGPAKHALMQMLRYAPPPPRRCTSARADARSTPLNSSGGCRTTIREPWTLFATSWEQRFRWSAPELAHPPTADDRPLRSSAPARSRKGRGA